jgi:hypothetical protein
MLTQWPYVLGINDTKIFYSGLVHDTFESRMAAPFSVRLLERMAEERSQLAFQPIISLDYLSPRGREHQNA